MFNLNLKHRLYYSAYIFAKKSIMRGEKYISREDIDLLYDSINPSIFLHDHELDKLQGKNTVLNYAVAMRMFATNKYNYSLKHLNKVKGNRLIFSESLMLKGMIGTITKRNEFAKKSYSSCIKSVKSKSKKSSLDKSYLGTIRNRCVQFLARIYFNEGNYKKSLKIQNLVKKEDYVWPRFIFDKSWNYYWLGDKYRALGSLLTYKAPVLRRFIVPEVNYLRSLIYFENCYFSKSNEIYKDFSKGLYKQRDIFRRITKKSLLNLISRKTAPKGEKYRFIYEYLKGYKKDVRFLRFKRSLRYLNSEVKRLQKVYGAKNTKRLLGILKSYKNVIINDFYAFLKNLSMDYYNQIEGINKAFVKLKLLSNLNNRKEIYNKDHEEEDVDSFLNTGLNKIDSGDRKFIWTFIGGFWADELGDYAVATKSRCKK